MKQLEKSKLKEFISYYMELSAMKKSKARKENRCAEKCYVDMKERKKIFNPYFRMKSFSDGSQEALLSHFYSPDHLSLSHVKQLL